MNWSQQMKSWPGSLLPQPPVHALPSKYSRHDARVLRLPARDLGDLARDLAQVGRQDPHVIRRVEGLHRHRHAEGHRRARLRPLDPQRHVAYARRRRTLRLHRAPIESRQEDETSGDEGYCEGSDARDYHTNAI
jgi:hypothetical protein